MADDQFTAELEWVCRLRRESVAITRLLRKVRSYVMLSGSSQNERSIRVWAHPELEKMHDDLDRVLSVLDPATARYLEGPVCTGYLAKGTVGANMVAGEIEDKREIKGPGRRHGYHHR